MSLTNPVALRQRLSSFTADGAPHACRKAMWPERLARISEAVEHTITIVELEPSPNYNCFTFALGLHESRKHFRIQWYTTRVTREEVFTNADFVTYLLLSGALQPSDTGNGLILYFDAEGSPMHAGGIRNGRVRSKWGTGCLVEHGIWEVPMEYGTTFAIYEAPDRQCMEEEFVRWAASVRRIDTAFVLERTKNI